MAICETSVYEAFFGFLLLQVNDTNNFRFVLFTKSYDLFINNKLKYNSTFRCVSKGRNIYMKMKRRDRIVKAKLKAVTSMK